MAKLKYTLIPILAALLLTACVSPSSIRGTGPLIEKSYPLESINRAVFFGSGEVHIVPSRKTSLVITAAQNVHEVLSVEVDSESLKVGPQHGIHLARSAKPAYTLYLNELEHLDLSGSMSVYADHLDGDQLSVNASGGVDGELLIQAQELTVRGSGSINLTLSGQTDRFHVHGSGSVKVDAGKLLARWVDLDLSGSSKITVWADDSLDVHSSGSTRVQYRGQPRISQDVSGSSSIEAWEE